MRVVQLRSLFEKVDGILGRRKRLLEGRTEGVDAPLGDLGDQVQVVAGRGRGCRGGLGLGRRDGLQVADAAAESGRLKLEYRA